MPGRTSWHGVSWIAGVANGVTVAKRASFAALLFVGFRAIGRLNPVGGNSIELVALIRPNPSTSARSHLHTATATFTPAISFPLAATVYLSGVGEATVADLQ